MGERKYIRYYESVFDEIPDLIESGSVNLIPIAEMLKKQVGIKDTSIMGDSIFFNFVDYVTLERGAGKMYLEIRVPRPGEIRLYYRNDGPYEEDHVVFKDVANIRELFLRLNSTYLPRYLNYMNEVKGKLSGVHSILDSNINRVSSQYLGAG